MLKKHGKLRIPLLLAVFITIATLSVYWQLQDHEFIDHDDPAYITENYHVKYGWTLEGILWSFTNYHSANWHPITWISHMLDVQFYGMNAGMHHFTNLLFHIANALLLFYIFHRMTRNLFSSAFIAALFALHPLNVESVAWAAERKNVLSTFFGFLTIWSYISYQENRNIKSYLCIVIFFALSLMSKPMLVTLPFVLLLLDYWPLGRFQNFSKIPFYPGKQLLSLIREKVPLFVLTFFSCIITLFSQHEGGAIVSLQKLSLFTRIANACISYMTYIKKMLWPTNLALFYPYLLELPLCQIAGAIFLFLLFLFLAIWYGRRYPYLFVGWLWYCITLIPVIGLVQVGSQSMADRYAYIPLIGLFILLAWGIPRLLAKHRFQKPFLVVLAGIFLSILYVLTAIQVGYWKTSYTIFQHTLEVTENNYFAYTKLGSSLANKGKGKEAIAYFQKALQIHPNYAMGIAYLGLALEEYQGNFSEALRCYRKAIELDPKNAVFYNYLGVLLTKQANWSEAIIALKKAVQLKPDYANAHNNLGIIFSKLGNFSAAEIHYRKAIQLDRRYTQAQNNLANLFVRQGKWKEALDIYNNVLRLAPENTSAHMNLAITLFQIGRLEEAIFYCHKAVQLSPKFAPAHYNLGVFLEARGNRQEALLHYQEALKLDPHWKDIQANIIRLQQE